MAETIWTAEDIATLRAAVASGVLSVSYAGPPARSVTYQSLGAMRELLAEMQRQVHKAPTYRLGAVHKGL